MGLRNEGRDTFPSFLSLSQFFSVSLFDSDRRGFFYEEEEEGGHLAT
jgi:hypothetical protein